MSNTNTYEYHYGQVLVVTGGALLMPVKTAAKILGLATQTIYNQINKNNFGFQVIKKGARSFVRASDLAEFISGCKPESTPKSIFPVSNFPQKRGPGRPPKDVPVSGEK